jgi:hypothetical protein
MKALVKSARLVASQVVYLLKIDQVNTPAQRAIDHSPYLGVGV